MTIENDPQTPDDHRAQQARAKAQGADEGDAARARDQALSDAEQTAADGDQTAADSDAIASAADEAAAYADQQSSDRDQAASDADQHSADEDESQGSPTFAEIERFARGRQSRIYTTANRTATTARRAATQSERARQELQRELAARRRDENAATRDRIAAQRDRVAARADRFQAEHTDDQALLRALEASEVIRNQAAADRVRAADDRVRAALDREQAAEERRQARLDVQRTQLDDLTGAYLSERGLVTLQHEIDRTRRSREPFVLGFIGVAGLDTIAAEHGHVAADALVQLVIDVLRAQLRSYDPIVRMTDGEFLCGFVSSEIEVAQRRIAEIQAAITAAQRLGSVHFGLAALAAGDTLDDLTARASAAAARA